MAEEKPIQYDVDGYDLLTEALMALINQYPGLADGDKFVFSATPTAAGKSVYATSGAIIQNEIEDITGHVTQMCQYPFTVLFRASGLSPKNRMTAKEWLDNLGRWLERQEITIDDITYDLEEYPDIKGNREIRYIKRQTPSYLSQVYEDKTEDWMISMNIIYRNEYDI